MIRKDFDDSSKIVEQTKVEGPDGSLVSLEQKVTYIDEEGKSHEYVAIGKGGVVEVIMPDSQRIDVEYARDSLDGVDYERVIVGVKSEDGVLIVPEDTVPLIVNLGYCISVTNEEMHVILYEDVVSSLAASEGDIILSIEPADSSNMNSRQMRAVGDNYAVSILLKLNGVEVTELDGDAEVILVPGYVSVNVYRVADNGSLELIESDYDQETGRLTFVVQHFSIYMVDAGKKAKTDTVPYVVAALILALVLIAALVIISKRRDRS